jgi:hypothetical protein
LPWLPNISKYATAHLERVEYAARFLMKVPQATMPEAMRVVRFDISDKTIVPLSITSTAPMARTTT